MDWLYHGFHLLSDFRSACSCALGEQVRELLHLDSLGHQYGYYFGEAICFSFHAQRKLFQHVLAAIHCYFGLISGYHRSGPLDFRDSWILLLLDLPRVAIVLFGLSMLHRILRFCWPTPMDQYTMGARLYALRVAEHQLRNNNNRDAVEAMIRCSRAAEFDRLFEFLLISPRYLWNGWPFGRIRNSWLGFLYLMILWLVYICPIGLRASLLIARSGVPDLFDSVDNVCDTPSMWRASVAVGFCSIIMCVLCLLIPSMIMDRTKEKRYH